MPHQKSSGLCFVNYLVIALLPTFFFAGILLGYLNIISLKVDIHSVIIIGLIYIIYLLFIQHNANYVICKMRKEHYILQQGLQKNIQENSLTIGNQTKATTDIIAYISEYFKTYRNDNFSSVAPSFFPMLGILGTFTAIAISMPDFAIKDAAALDSEISLLLSGIGTAFYASIYGIFLSILWNYFEKRGLSKADSDLYGFESTYNKFIWTQSELKRNEHTQNDIRDQKLIEGLKEVFNLEFIQLLNEKHLDNFQTIINETNRNFTSVTKHLQLVSTDLKDTISQIHKSKNALEANDSIEKNIQHFTQTTNRLNNSLERFDASLEKSLNMTFHKIDDELGDVIMKLGDFSSTILEQNEVTQESISKYHSQISDKLANN
ncbi:MAG: MotA/TolQ/ExbB proton channel family protein [Sulfurovaceae bacterium]|nr:MotA/TolQ/ExbB proton channel family protein [Sulfurovaceae bacterium]